MKTIIQRRMVTIGHDWRTEGDVFSGSSREINENGNDRPQKHDWRTEMMLPQALVGR